MVSYDTEVNGENQVELSDELICQYIGKSVIDCIRALEIDFKTVAQTTALSALAEIKAIIQKNELSDFMMVDEIVNVFNKYNISSGSCHDFG